MGKIILNDVTLRDGLQNEPYFVPTREKIKLINLIIDSGIKHLEITSFVNPKAIPQLSDAYELSNSELIKPAYLSALVPNLTGFKRCINSKIDEAVLFISACEEHNIKNLGKNINNSLEQINEIFTEYRGEKINFRTAVSMVFGSPFTNDLPDEKNLYEIIDFFIKNGVKEITLSDTWGKSDKKLFEKQLKQILKDFDFENFSLHLHDIQSNGITNSEIGLDLGIKKFDTCFEKLGGCPFSPDKGANLNVLKFVKIAENKGFYCDIDKEKCLQIEKFLYEIKISGGKNGLQLS